MSAASKPSLLLPPHLTRRPPIPRLEAPREMRLARIAVPISHFTDIQTTGLRATEQAVGEFEAAFGDVAAG